MRVLLDESLPRQLVRELKSHTVHTVREMGWNSIKNGELIKVARADGFEVLVTADQNLEYQQNLKRAEIGIVVVAARTNRIEDLLPLVPSLLQAITAVERGQVRHVR